MENPNPLASMDEELRRKYPTIKTGRISCDLGETLALVEALGAAETEADINKIGEKFCQQNGVAHAGVLMMEKGAKQHSARPAFMYNIGAYTNAYIAEKIFDIDPVIYRSRQEVLPIAWGLEQHFIDPTPIERKHQSFLADWGNPKAVALPLHGADCHSMLAIKVYDSNADFNKRLIELALKAQIFGVNLHDAVRRISHEQTRPPLPPPPRLTLRETECLHWAAAGKTAWEISCILGVSERTVVAHTENAKKKLDAKTLPQAVARAVGLGAITP